MKNSEINKLIGVDESYKAPSAIMDIVLSGDVKSRNVAYNKFLDAFNHDLSYEWFNDYFEDEHADRAGKKQDFTPKSLSGVMSAMMGGGNKGISYEPAAGNGSLVINKWDFDRLSCDPFEYRPGDFIYVCSELSDRSVPFLLFNMAIRGMMGVVYHGNTLMGNYKEIYLVVNKCNFHLNFSDVYKLSEEFQLLEKYGKK